MARKKHHEDHVNHEAWAIPYGDLITLLLAFFVVMYAVSSVNEGKYRVLSNSMVAAFRGAPKSMQPIQIGQSLPTGTVQSGDSNTLPYGVSDPRSLHLPRGVLEQIIKQSIELVEERDEERGLRGEAIGHRELEHSLDVEQRMQRVFDDLTVALRQLIDVGEVRIRVQQNVVELELNTDLLFPVGVETVNSGAVPALTDIASILAPYDNPVRVEGHTDTTPISTLRFPSNWELSAARAANVVRLFADNGVDPSRLAAIGYGEFQPVADNANSTGRARNRRVKIVILSSAAEAAEIGSAQSVAEPAGTGFAEESS
ncbi:MAG: flagellar motor protein MotD [Wenzhouxiangellaceae bacterium]|nr:flagellar motor protein MotD [Wenzhouxiangellaceae bacterium]